MMEELRIDLSNSVYIVSAFRSQCPVRVNNDSPILSSSAGESPFRSA